MIYRHFKGGFYRVRGTATHSETREAMVVYSHLGEENTWVRPVDMFSESVEIDGKTVPRFEQVPTKIMTLCEVTDGNRILLGYKKRGFGMGKWNGFGGKPYAGETLEECVRREVLEEIELKVLSCAERGRMFFLFPNNPELVEVPLFHVTRWTGDPRESDEIRPQWFDVKALDYDAMWPDDRYWLPELLKGKNVEGFFEFDKGGSIRKMEVEFS